MSKEFAERRHESFYLIGSRVPLPTSCGNFSAGESPEAIRSHYPALSIEQIYGAIAFYLGNREDVEADIAGTRAPRGCFHCSPSSTSRSQDDV